MLPVAFTAALFLGVAHPAVADRPRFPRGNSTTNATESRVAPEVVWTTVTEIVTQTFGPACSANDAQDPKPTATASPTATFINSPPAATLSPNVHWAYDTKAVENVIPVEPDKGCELYYGASDPSQSGYYAFVTYHFESPAVNIDHSDHIAAEYHKEKGMTVSFHNEEAFKHALSTWTVTNGLILIAYIPGCGDYAKGERCYLNVTDIEYKHDAMVIVARGDSMHPDQITNLGETEWGWWNANTDEAQASSASDSGNGFARGTSTASASSSSPTGASSGSKKPLGQLDCTAPYDTIHGLSTACLGNNFDEILDQKLGYTKLSAEAKTFLDGLSSSSKSTTQANSTLSTRARRMRRRSLAERGFWSGVWDFSKQVSEKVYDAVKSIIHIGAEVDRDIGFKVPDPESPITLLSDLTQTQSPWGEAILLKSIGSPDEADEYGSKQYLNVYCVGCGASGHARIAGRAKWSPFDGLQEGRLEMQVNMQFFLKLGIDANFSIKKTWDYDLFDYGLPELSFGVVTIGPYVSIGARAGLEGAMHGNVLVGAEIGMQDSSVVFKPVFEASGDLKLSTELGLPLGFKCGLKISSWEEAVGFVDEPSIQGLASAHVSANMTNFGNIATEFGEVNGCQGLLTEISWRNRFWAGLIDPDDTPVLDNQEGTLFRKCIGKDSQNSQDSQDSQDNKDSKDNKPARRELVHGSRPAPRQSSKALTYHVESVPTKLYDDALGHSLQPLVNPAGSTRLVSCANGNVHAVQNDHQTNPHCFAVWQTTNASNVVYDGVHRPLHYYGETMSKLGVSRLRVSDSARVPRTAVTVALMLFQIPDGGDLYLPVDETKRVLYPVVCDFADGSASKVFVATNAAQGIETLQRSDVEHSITGGRVSRCFPLALTK